jgi:hypothetical protein
VVFLRLLAAAKQGDRGSHRGQDHDKRRETLHQEESMTSSSLYGTG